VQLTITGATRNECEFMNVNDAFISSRRKATGALRPRRRGPAGLRSELTGVFRRAILDAAERVFGTQGFARAKMTEIAERAGLAAGTLYNYFDSKEAIFRALLEERGEELSARLEPIAGGPGDARGKLVQLIRSTFEYVESHGPMLTLILQVGGAACTGKSGADPGASRQYRRTLAVYQASLTAATRQGLVRAGLDVRELAAVLAGAMCGLVRSWLLAGRRGRLGDRADFLVDLFLSGAGTRS
jgi:AcrR family transcriptional regulator